MTTEEDFYSSLSPSLREPSSNDKRRDQSQNQSWYDRSASGTNDDIPSTIDFKDAPVISKFKQHRYSI